MTGPQSPSLNPRIFVGAAVVVVAVVIGAIAFSGQGIIDDTSDRGLLASPENPPMPILPLVTTLEKLEVAEIDDRAAYIDIKFKVSNPNQRSVILQLVKYQVYEDDLRIHAGQIGDRFEGFVEGSNFYTVLSGSHTILSETIVIRNTGNVPGLWETLSGDDIDWRVTGEGFFNLSSMTAGAEQNFTFELKP